MKMRLLFFSVLTLAACGVDGPKSSSNLNDLTLDEPFVVLDPNDPLQFVKLSPFNSRTNSKWGPALTDIVNHEAPGDRNNYDDLVTVGHETSHGIHAYIRQHFSNSADANSLARVNGFYVLNNQAVVLPEPNFRKSQVARFVPPSLRGSRYSTYVTGQTAWDDTPLYLFDEWNAYINGGVVGVDLVQRGLWTYGWRDAVMGQLEFNVYALALAMAAQQFDPNYLQSQAQFVRFLEFNLQRSMQSYKLGAVMPAFKSESQDRYYQNLLTSPDAEALRTFTRNLMGAEWSRAVMGF